MDHQTINSTIPAIQVRLLLKDYCMLNYKDETGFVSGLKSCVSQSAVGPVHQLGLLCCAFSNAESWTKPQSSEFGSRDRSLLCFSPTFQFGLCILTDSQDDSCAWRFGAQSLTHFR